MPFPQSILDMIAVKYSLTSHKYYLVLRLNTYNIKENNLVIQIQDSLDPDQVLQQEITVGWF